MAEMIAVEVAFADPEKQLIISIQIAKGASVKQAIDDSGIVEQMTGIDLAKMVVGVWSKECQLDKAVLEGDRIEIYRPLKHNPMDARRGRAIKQR